MNRHPRRPRLGAPVTITQGGIGTETRAYHPGTGAPASVTYPTAHALLPGKSIAWPEPDEFGRPLGLTPSHGLTRSVFQSFGCAALAAPGVSEVRKELWPGAVLPLGFHLRKERPVRTGPFA